MLSLTFVYQELAACAILFIIDSKRYCNYSSSYGVSSFYSYYHSTTRAIAMLI